AKPSPRRSASSTGAVGGRTVTQAHLRSGAGGAGEAARSTGATAPTAGRATATHISAASRQRATPATATSGRSGGLGGTRSPTSPPTGEWKTHAGAPASTRARPAAARPGNGHTTTRTRPPLCAPSVGPTAWTSPATCRCACPATAGLAAPSRESRGRRHDAIPARRRALGGSPRSSHLVLLGSPRFSDRGPHRRAARVPPPDRGGRRRSRVLHGVAV